MPSASNKIQIIAGSLTAIPFTSKDAEHHDLPTYIKIYINFEKYFFQLW